MIARTGCSRCAHLLKRVAELKSQEARLAESAKRMSDRQLSRAGDRFGAVADALHRANREFETHAATHERAETWERLASDEAALELMAAREDAESGEVAHP